MFQEIVMPASLYFQLPSVLEIQFLNLSFASYGREGEIINR